MVRKSVIKILGLVILLGVLAFLFRPRQIIKAQSYKQRLPQAPSRTGAWVDSVVFTQEDSTADAIAHLQDNQLDIFAYPVADPSLFQAVQQDPDLDYTQSFGSYNELTINPAGLNFIDGRLNPFHNYKIREALNWLVDRDYIAQNFFGGLAIPKYVPLTATFPDYERYSDTIYGIETTYAYDPSRAINVIHTEMKNMGAILVDGKWYYNSQLVTIIFLIRTEDPRLQIGDYVADQLEIAGFTVDRHYVTRVQASPIWNQTNPAEGQWHIYTGGWLTTDVSRDDATNFGYFYTPRGSASPLWQAYTPSPEFDEVAGRLWSNDFTNMVERETLFTQALGYAMHDTGAGSVRVWLVDQKAFSPRRANTVVASDLAGGIVGGKSWPYTVRFSGMEGGTMRVAQLGLLVSPWNPIGGSSSIYDLMPIQATQDYADMRDPHDGLTWQQRLESAEIVIKEGLPVTRTHEWVTFTFSPVITVPMDAWVDWDATNQSFITAGEKYTETQTANVKSIVTYPADLFQTVKWHDGSPLDLSDFVMRMIMAFDPGKPESPIYDESQASTIEAFLSHFKGVRITSTDPLIIETYDDLYQLDAERNIQTWWPNYTHGPAAWHNLAVGLRAEAAHALAFTSDKAYTLGIEWMNFINGSSLGILKGYLDENAASNFIPYTSTLSSYVTAEEAQARWANLQAWYTAHGNFWIGTGPFYLEQITPTLTLRRFADFPDPSDKWDFFVQNPTAQLNYIDGAPGSFFTINGDSFPANSIAHVYVNTQELGTVTTDASGNFTILLDTAGADEGFYNVMAEVNPFALASFTLDAEKPVHPQEGIGTIFTIPPGMIYTSKLYLPMVNR